MSSFKDFLRWYYKKDAFSSLEAMQKMIPFHHNKKFDMLKLGCTFPNLANICLRKSTDAKICPFTEGIEELLKRLRDTSRADHFLFTRKTVVDKIIFGNRPICANQMLALMVVNGILSQCVSFCQQVFTRVGILIR